MNKPLIGVLLAASALSTPAAVAADAKSKDKDPDQVVCFMEARTGSHLRKRVCMTEQEREARRQANQEAMAASQRGKGANSQDTSQGGFR